MKKSRLNTLSRLQSLSSIEAREQAASLSRANTKLFKTEQRLKKEIKIFRGEASLGLAALAESNSEGWFLSRAQQESATRNIEVLEKLQIEQSREQEKTSLLYLEVREKKSQLDATARSASIAFNEERARREQNELDDRYSARLSWNKNARQRTMKLC